MTQVTAVREPDIAGTAGLAHDLGHPPFDHAVTKLASRAEETYGLNLTRASLNAILKYPQYRDEVEYGTFETRPWTDRAYGTKWGAYASEKRDFDHAREGAEHPYMRSVGTILMDWADDVSFATHDLDDYYRTDLIPLHTIQKDASAFYDFTEAQNTAGKHPLTGYDHEEFMSAYERIVRAEPLRRKGSCAFARTSSTRSRC